MEDDICQHLTTLHIRQRVNGSLGGFGSLLHQFVQQHQHTVQVSAWSPAAMA